MSQAYDAGPLPEITESDHGRVRAHYERALDVLVRHFGGTPVIAATYPAGLGTDPVYHKGLADPPATVATVAVQTSTGMHAYPRLDARNVSWLVAGRFAVEFHSWSPTRDDPARAAFGRLILAPSGTAGDDLVVTAATLLRDALAAERLKAIPLLDGFRGMSLWIPLDDGPAYQVLGPWLHDFAAAVAQSNPDALTTAPLLHERGNRIYLGTKSNHPGMGSLLPYALRGTPSLEVSIPIAWSDLGTLANGSVTESGFAEYLRLFGDVFAAERKRIGPQSLGDRSNGKLTSPIHALAAPEPGTRGYIIAAALAVLADGRAHDADDILAGALERKLLPPSTTRKYVYTALHEYVERTLGAGKVPELVQVPGSAQFRLNEPADPWPAVSLAPPTRWVAARDVDALVERLRATATGGDPTAFEVAACDAFAALGFLATHVGGNAAPDGILTAPLGVMAYRVILECKTASPGGIVSNPRPEEPAKFMADAGAQHALLLGPAFGKDASLDDELVQHGVSLWTVDDLATALVQQIGPDELREALAPGRAEVALRALLWERDHGRRKRIEVIAELTARLGWDLQRTLAQGVALDQVPPLTEETLFMLVDEELVHESVTAGATLEEARAALQLLETRGLLRKIDDAYVLRQPPSV